MTYLLVGDLHLTDRPKDAYRFGIFEWIRKQQLKHKLKATFILGDIGDQKDRHSSILVNKLIHGLSQIEPPIYVLMGNHDYIDPRNPFFKFLSNIPGIMFVLNPTELINDRIALIPHYRTQVEFDNAIKDIDQPDYLLLHQTFDGAIAETGSRLTGLDTASIELLAPRLGVYAGDVHKPQQAGPVTYIGSPYTIRFGDDFDPRVILVSNGKPTNLYPDFIRKWKFTVRSAADILNNDTLIKGDQVKVTVELAREEAVEWKIYKKDILIACEKKGVEVFGVELKINTSTRKDRPVLDKVVKSNKDILIEYGKAENLSAPVRQAGLQILED